MELPKEIADFLIELFIINSNSIMDTQPPSKMKILNPNISLNLENGIIIDQIINIINNLGLIDNIG